MGNRQIISEQIKDLWSKTKGLVEEEGVHLGDSLPFVYSELYHQFNLRRSIKNSSIV